MIIHFHNSFEKSYRKRISFSKQLALKTQLKTTLFKTNTKDPSLRDHELTGIKKGLRAFSVNGDIRIIYKILSHNEVVFIDIGSHNQVY